jgi:hypothetical protein
MTQGEFAKAVRAFDDGEPMRAQLYSRALNLIRAGFRLEAHLLILATWNFARFRYVTRDFDLRGYENTLADLDELLRPLDSYDFLATNLNEHRTRIVQAFDLLSSIEGIRYTGAAKILHLLHPRFFVMWDRFISGHYPKHRYRSLDIVQSGFWPYRRFRSSGDGYYEFLEFCQMRFRGLVSPDSRKTLAKCIDEFNFYKMTAPIGEAVRRDTEQARKKGQRGKAAKGIGSRLDNPSE